MPSKSGGLNPNAQSFTYASSASTATFAQPGMPQLATATSSSSTFAAVASLEGQAYNFKHDHSNWLLTMPQNIYCPQSRSGYQSVCNQADSSSTSDCNRQIVIKNIPYSLDAAEILLLLRQLNLKPAEGNALQLHKDPQTQRSLGLAFVSFATSEDAGQAIAMLNDHTVQGRRLRAEPKMDREARQAIAQRKLVAECSELQAEMVAFSTDPTRQQMTYAKQKMGGAQIQFILATAASLGLGVLFFFTATTLVCKACKWAGKIVDCDVGVINDTRLQLVKSLDAWTRAIAQQQKYSQQNGNCSDGTDAVGNDRQSEKPKPDRATLQAAYQARLAAHKQQQQSRSKQKTNSSGAMAPVATMALGPAADCGCGFLVHRRARPKIEAKRLPVDQPAALNSTDTKMS